MRFWVKGKQGEKKTPREKLATQSELLELYAEQEAPNREMISGLQLGEGECWVSTQQGHVCKGQRNCICCHGRDKMWDCFKPGFALPLSVAPCMVAWVKM